MPFPENDALNAVVAMVPVPSSAHMRRLRTTTRTMGKEVVASSRGLVSTSGRRVVRLGTKVACPMMPVTKIISIITPSKI